MRRPEQALQQNVAQFLDVALDPLIPWTAIGHGGGGKVRGAILKSMGVKPGWPDIMVFGPQPFFIELKRVSGGHLSPEQKTLHAQFMARGIMVYVCRSLEEVERALLREGLRLRATCRSMLLSSSSNLVAKSAASPPIKSAQS